MGEGARMLLLSPHHIVKKIKRNWCSRLISTRLLLPYQLIKTGELLVYSKTEVLIDTRWTNRFECCPDC